MDFSKYTISLGNHFTLKEFLRSDYIYRSGDLSLYLSQTTLTSTVVSNLLSLVSNVLDPLRESFGEPIIINSGYRCEELNRLVGGVSNSQHVFGQAADITSTDNGKLLQLILKLHRKGTLVFDQLIIYGSQYKPRFLHISYNEGNNRRQILYQS